MRPGGTRVESSVTRNCSISSRYLPKLTPPVQPEVRILRGGTSGNPCASRTSASRSSRHTRNISISSADSISPSRYRKPTTSDRSCHGEHINVTSSRSSTKIVKRISPITPASTTSALSPTKRVYCRGTTGVSASVSLSTSIAQASSSAHSASGTASSITEPVVSGRR